MKTRLGDRFSAEQEALRVVNFGNKWLEAQRLCVQDLEDLSDISGGAAV